MISNTAIAAIAIVAVVAVGGGIAAAILMNQGGEDDSKLVIYDGNGQKMKDGGPLLSPCLFYRGICSPLSGILSVPKTEHWGNGVGDLPSKCLSRAPPAEVQPQLIQGI